MMVPRHVSYSDSINVAISRICVAHLKLELELIYT
jgi:hypothetical protein